MADPTPFRYRAFLSYSHRDKVWGESLHRTLERYRIARDLVGRATPAGPVPASLRPIFRDREDFSAGPSLAAQTLAALESSQFLIVLCSPNAACSAYVNEEVRRFKMLGRGQSIIPVIVGGSPADGDCFPPALRFAVNADGALTGESEEPIAADARDTGDGRILASRKVVAGLIGVSLDEIVRRAERDRRRRNRFWMAIAGLFLLLAVATTASAVYAWHQLRTNEEFLDATLDRFTSLVNRAISSAQSHSLPLRVSLGFLEEAEGMLIVMARYGRPTPKLRRRQIAMLVAFGDSYRQLGRTAEAERRIDQAQRLAADLARDNAADPQWRWEQARAQQRRGDLEMSKGDLDAALREFRSVQAIIEQLVARDPTNWPWRRDLSLAHERIGLVEVEQGRFDDALVSFTTVLALRQKLLDEAPGDFQRNQDLAVAHERMGEIQRAFARWTESLASFRASLAIVQRLASAQPDNVEVQRNLSIVQVNVGTVLYQQKEFAEAIDHFRAALAVSARLVASDRQNAEWQRGLSVVHERLGDVLAAQQRLEEALPHFQASHAIRLAIALADSDNTAWQSDLALSHERLGSIYAALKRISEAQTEFDTARAIYVALLTRAPDHPRLLFGSAMPLLRLGMLHGAAGIPYLEEALGILRDLDRSGRLDPRRRSMIATIEQTLRDLRAKPAQP